MHFKWSFAITDHFQKNLEKWAKAAPKEAWMLPYTDASSYTLCKTDLGESNLQGPNGCLHDHAGAVKEANDWFAKCQLEGVSVLFVFGVGLGYYYLPLKKWLKKDKTRHVVFLERDTAVLYHLFHTQIGTDIVHDPQVSLYVCKTLQESESSLEELYWNFAMRPLAMAALESYAKTFSTFYEELSHSIASSAATKNALLDEYLRYGGAFFLNFYPNLLSLPENYLGNRLFGKFAKIPAIICGAGPSLQKQLPLLAQLQDKAIFFGGGSAMNALNAGGIIPHFGAGIDPNPMQFERLSQNEAFETPYFYRNRLFHDALLAIHGPKLYVTGTGGYELSDWFEEQLGIASDFIDEGHNVVNFCTEIAYAMGCDPIIYVGMDLGFTDMKTYSPGVEEETQVNAAQILSAENFDERALLKTDIYGKPLYTLWKWIAEAEWIGRFAALHPHATLVNCTEGGLGFPGVSNQDLKTFADKWLTASFELTDRIHGEIMNSKVPSITQKKLQELLKKWQKSLQQSVAHLDVLLEDNEAQEKKLKKKEPATQGGLAALAETELAEEPAYTHLLSMFNLVYSRLLNGELHQIRTAKSSEDKKSLEKLKLAHKKLTFLRNTAQINSELITFTLKEKALLQKSLPKG